MAKPKDPGLRLRLLQAASTEFTEKGFAATNLIEIGQRAEVTKGGVYFHFRGKEELFFAVVDYWREAQRQLIQAPADGEPATLRTFLVGYLEFHFQHPEASGLMRVLAAEMRDRFTTRVREDHQAALRAIRSRIRELLMQGTHDGSLFTTDPAMATFFRVPDGMRTRFGIRRAWSISCWRRMSQRASAEQRRQADATG